MRWDVEFDNGVTAPAEPEERPRRGPVEAAVPVGHLRPAARLRQTTPRRTSTASRCARSCSSWSRPTAAVGRRPRPAVHRRPDPLTLARSVRWPVSRTRSAESKSFWDEVERADAAIPDKERPDGTVVRDNVSALVLGSQRAVRGVPLLLPPGQTSARVRPGLQTRLRRAVAGPAGLRLPRRRAVCLRTIRGCSGCSGWWWTWWSSSTTRTRSWGRADWYAWSRGATFQRIRRGRR